MLQNNFLCRSSSNWSSNGKGTPLSPPPRFPTPPLCTPPLPTPPFLSPPFPLPTVVRMIHYQLPNRRGVGKGTGTDRWYDDIPSVSTRFLPNSPFVDVFCVLSKSFLDVRRRLRRRQQRRDCYCVCCSAFFLKFIRLCAECHLQTVLSGRATEVVRRNSKIPPSSHRLYTST